MKRILAALVIVFTVYSAVVIIPYPCFLEPCTTGRVWCPPDQDCREFIEHPKHRNVKPATLNAGELSANIALMLERGG